MRSSRRVKAVLASASVFIITQFSYGTVDTWTGGRPVLRNSYLSRREPSWDLTTANWSNGGSDLYTVGDNAVFTDDFTGNTGIIVATGNLDPSSIEFEHVAGSSTPTNYILYSSYALANNYSTSYSATSTTLFGTGYTVRPTLTLDAGFLGSVEIQPRPSSSITNVFGSTVIDGGTLILDDGGALPQWSSNSNPNVTMGGGTLEINVTATDDNNVAPASSQLKGLMSVVANSTLAMGPNVSSSTPRTWNGSIVLSPGTTLFFDGLETNTANPTQANEMALAATVTGNGTLSLGSTNTTLRLDATGTANAGVTYDVGTGSGILRSDLGTSSTFNLGALNGGATTSLQGSESSTPTLATYSVGALANSNFGGTITDFNTTGTVALTKVGSTVLTLSNSASTYTGGTTINLGTVAATGGSGTPFGVGNITLNGGSLKLAPSGSLAAVEITGASGTAASQFIYAGSGTLSLNKGAEASLTFSVGNSAPTAGSPLVSRSGQGTLIIAPSGGTSPSNLGQTELFVVNSTTAGNTPVVTNGIVNTSIIGQNNDANGSGDFLTYDNSKGFILAAYGDTNFAAPSPTSTELVTTAQPSLASNNVFALNAEANITLASGSTLTIGNDGSGAGQSGQAGLILNNGATISGSGGTLSFGAAEGTIYTSGAGGAISVPITGNGGVTTFGPGVLAISGNFADTGTTNINGGTVILSGENSAATGATNIGIGATLQLQANAGNTTGGINTALSQTSAGLAMNLNSTLQLRADAPTTFYNDANGISMNSKSVTIDVNQLTSAGTNNVLTLAPAGFSAGSSTINITGGHGYSLSLGEISNPTNTSVDLLNPTTATVSVAGFTSTSTSNGTDFIGLDGTSSGNAVTGIISNNASQSSAMAGVIKSNTSTWTLSGANTYSGGTTISGGVLALNNPSTVGPSGTISFTGGTLQFSANNTVDYSSRILIGDGQNAILDTNGQNITLASTMLNGPGKTGALTKIGSGTLTVSATNTFIGGTTVNSGKLLLSIANALASGSPVANNASLEIGAATTLGNVTGTGATTVDATQTLTTNNFSQAAGLVNNGTTQINGQGLVGPISGTGTLVVGSGTSNNTVMLATGSGLNTQGGLTISAGSTLDLNNDHLVINYGSGADPMASIIALIKTGYANGAWNGGGIDSSAAAATHASYGIGYADSSDPGNPAQLASGTLEIAYTLLGDANLDHKVNGTDFAILAANFNQSVTSWDQGDFNYDNKANGIDFTELAANFNQGASQAADTAALDAFASANGISLTSVPEPASVGLLVAVGAGLLSRRRRRQS